MFTTKSYEKAPIILFLARYTYKLTQALLWKIMQYQRLLNKAWIFDVGLKVTKIFLRQRDRNLFLQCNSVSTQRNMGYKSLRILSVNKEGKCTVYSIVKSRLNFVCKIDIVLSINTSQMWRHCRVLIYMRYCHVTLLLLLLFRV